MSDTEKLVILGKLDSHIRKFSHRTYIRNLGLETEDLIQEGRIKVLSLIDEYEHLSTSDLISTCVRSLVRFYGALVRKDHFARNSGVLVDLDEAFYLSDPEQLHNLYMHLQVHQLMEIMDGDEKVVLQCLLDPPEDLVKLAQEHYEGYVKAEVKITKSILSEFLGITKKRLRMILEDIRIKAEPVLVG